MPVDPIAYASLYQNLLVRVDNHNLSIPVTRYLSGRECTAGKEPMRAAIKHYILTKKKTDPGFIWHPGVPVQMFPQVGMFGFYNYEQMCQGLVSCYCGKGSPEWLSFVLHCALQFKLSSPGQLDAYAADNLGIDCSGFVGNYILHGFLGLDGFYGQSSKGMTSKGPSSLITQLVPPPYLKRLDQFAPASTYTLGMIAKDGHMPAGNGDTGHVMVTVPNSNKPSPPMLGHVRTGPQSYTVKVMESRGGGGLLPASDYTFVSVDEQSIFKVYRGGSKSFMRVKVSKL